MILKNEIIESLKNISQTYKKSKYYKSNNFDIFLEKASLSGLDEMHNYSSDPRLYEFFEFEVFKSKKETEEYLNKLITRMADTSDLLSFHWFIRRKIDNKMLGSCGLVNLNCSRKSVEWGYAIDPEFWGTGYILQVQEILKFYVFELLNLNRLYGVTMLSNSRTIESILASGFSHEGTSKDFYCKNERYIDGWHYGMTRKDYFNKNTKKIIKNNEIKKSQLIELIASILTEDDVDENASMENLPSWDSLNHMLIIISLKDTFGIELNPSEIADANSIKELMTIIRRKNKN